MTVRSSPTRRRQRQIPFRCYFGRAARDAHRGVVLLRTVDVVRKIVVERDAIKLRRRLILFGPASPAVVGDIRAAVVALDHPVGIVRSDPEIVVVAMRNIDRAKSDCAVIRFEEANVQNVNRIDVLRICIDTRVVPRALSQRRCSFTLVHVCPPLSERNTPPSSASTIAHTRSGFAGDTVIPTLPTMPRGKPLIRVNSVHVSPPSVDLKMPLPGPPLSSVHGLLNFPETRVDRVCLKDRGSDRWRPPCCRD